MCQSGRCGDTPSDVPIENRLPHFSASPSIIAKRRSLTAIFLANVQDQVWRHLANVSRKSGEPGRMSGVRGEPGMRLARAGLGCLAAHGKSPSRRERAGTVGCLHGACLGWRARTSGRLAALGGRWPARTRRKRWMGRLDAQGPSILVGAPMRKGNSVLRRRMRAKIRAGNTDAIRESNACNHPRAADGRARMAAKGSELGTRGNPASPRRVARGTGADMLGQRR